MSTSQPTHPWSPPRLRGRLSSVGGALVALFAWIACANGELPIVPDDAPVVDLSMSQSVTDATPDELQEVTFTLQVRNLGPIDAAGVVALDSLPSGVTYVSHTESMGTYRTATGVWEIGALADSAVATLTLRVRVNAGTGNVTLRNWAGVASDTMRDSVIANNVATTQLLVNAPPVPGGVVFQSNWAAALGNSANAVTDGGVWPTLVCQNTFPNVLTVVSGSSVGFAATPNVLRVQQRGPTDCGMLQRDGILPQSTTHWGRFYWRNDDVGSSQNHPTAYHQFNGQFQLVPWLRDAALSGGQHRIGIQVGQNGYPYQKWFSPPLQNGVWYRYEWQVEYVTATTFRIFPRIYDATGALLYDHTDFQQTDYSRASDLTLDEFYALNAGTRTFTLGVDAGETNVTLARNFGMGNEGNASAPATMGYWYYAKVGFSTAGWLGP